MDVTMVRPGEGSTKSANAVEASTDLIVAEAQANPVALFTDEHRYSEFYERVKESVSAFVPDVSTDKGRREIASVAFRVTKSKTALDKAGLALTEEWRKQTAAVNAARKKMTTELDELAAEVRRPLTEWEEAEDRRQERCQAVIAKLKAATTVEFGETSADVERRRADIAAMTFDADEFEGFAEQAVAYREQALAALASAVARLRQEEADRAELERLRREREELAARAVEEARQREEEAARRRAEEDRAKAAQEADERRRREIAEAEERARREAEERARAEERRVAEEKLAEERRQREVAEAEAAEARRKEQERIAWEDKERREREAREADDRHRKAVIEEVAEDITDALGRKRGEAPSPELMNVARAVANAIAAGTVRHVAVSF